MIYFNEIEPFAAQWCRNSFGGRVDERDIRTIEYPVDALRQHYFAGLGGWEYALRLAGWPEDREVWTGSCPCQPFSVAGRQEAHEDERDLWPAFFRLIAVARPAVILGEQVAGAITFGWLDRICDDLEAIGYAIGAAVLPAASVGAPHIRQRLYWVAIGLGNSDESGREAREHLPVGAETRSQRAPQPSTSVGVGDSDGGRRQERDQKGGNFQGHQSNQNGRLWVADTDSAANARHREYSRPGPSQPEPESHWAASRSIECADGRQRRVPTEPGFLPLADSGRFGNPRVDSDVSSRIGTLKGAGNAIVIPLAAEFIKAVIETLK